jgi:2-ketoarginine methyltransferase
VNDFEFRLVEVLQPIRHFFLAQAIEFGLRSGLLERLAADERATLHETAEALGMDPQRLAGLLRYLAAEGIVAELEHHPVLTRRGREFLEFRPWYELLIGGYDSTLKELPFVMKSEKVYAARNDAMVGKGSCGISRYDAIPMVRRLLTHISEPVETLVDLGCGDGTFLLELCGDTGRGIGVDPITSSIDRAQASALACGRADRVTFTAAAAEDFVEQPLALRAPCFITAFSLQEVLEQRGREAVVTLVRRVLANPGAHLIVVEVDHRPTDASIMRHGLGLAYYNPYYLLHQLTEQRLETVAFWRELFAEATADVVMQLTTDPEVDSTGLEIGFLLSRAA